MSTPRRMAVSQARPWSATLRNGACETPREYQTPRGKPNAIFPIGRSAISRNGVFFFLLIELKKRYMYYDTELCCHVILHNLVDYVISAVQYVEAYQRYHVIDKS